MQIFAIYVILENGLKFTIYMATDHSYMPLSDQTREAVPQANDVPSLLVYFGRVLTEEDR